MSDRLEAALMDLGSRIDFPATPDFTLAPVNSPRRARWRAVAVAVAALVVVVLAMPGPRQAVANLFRIGAVGLVVVDELPLVGTVSSPGGTEMTLTEAAELVGFEIAILDAEPSAVFVDQSVPGGMVTLGYGRIGGSYRLLITQLQGEAHPALTKVLTPDVEVLSVTVDGEAGIWIEDGPHLILLTDRFGRDLESPARLAGNTLVFTRGDVTIRIEGELSLQQALEIVTELH